jgi:uncharacterized protein with FMN-binding domain
MPGGFVGKAVLILGGTAAGLGALLSFRTHSPASADTTASAPGAQVTVPPVPGTAAAATAAPATTAPATATPGTTTRGTTTPATTAPATTAPASASAAPQTRAITGAVENTPYGPMQVKVTLTGSRITEVAVVQQTNDGAESQQIDSFAIPKLNAETLTAQSARIDTVSGATATSTGYIGSLQSALDQA